MFKGLFSTTNTSTTQKPAKKVSDKKRAQMYRDLIRKEAVIGGEVFGPVPKGVRREFFCLDEHTWVWHEEWTDHAGKRHIQTTRYDVRQDGIVKCQNDEPYKRISPQELKNLAAATNRYQELVLSRIYRIHSTRQDSTQTV